MSRIRKNILISGFTLIELLLVMVISSVLILGINSAYKQTHALWSRIEENRVASQLSRSFINTLRTELSGIYILKTDEEEELNSFELTTLADSVNLSFFTLTPIWQSSIMASKIAKVSYDFSNDTEANKKIVTRTQQLYSGHIPVSVPQTQTILDGLLDFDVQAQDPNSQDNTDFKQNLLTPNNLPKAVKIKLLWPKTRYLTQNQFQTTILVLAGGYCPKSQSN